MISLDTFEPPTYECDELMFDITFHPYNDIIAASLITGEVKLLSCTSTETKELATLKNHKSSCRTCLFAPNGKSLISASEDCSIALIDENGKLVSRIKNAHEFPIYSLYYISDTLFASGDDEGVVKIWDINSGKCVYDCHEQSGTITDFVVTEDKNMLLSTSTDGSLGVYNLKKANTSKDKLYALSDSMEEDLLAITIAKEGKKVLCTSQEGSIFIFKWDWFGQSADKISGHPNSVDAMIKLDENTVFTGCEDGFIRAVSIYPNKIISFLGQHSESEEVQPIQRMAFNRNRNIIATCSYDSKIRFHNVAKFVNKRSGEHIEPMAEDDEEMIEDEKDFVDMEGEDDFDDSDDDDDSFEEEGAPKKFNSKAKGGLDLGELSKAKTTKARKKMIQGQQRKNFFSDI